MITDPHPIGYIELQRGWIGVPETVHDTVQKYLHELDVSVQREHPGMRPHGSRLEVVPDGAGVLHYTLYAGYAPFPPKTGVEPTPPLNPRNLNDAESPQIGNAVEDHAIGMKEQRF